MNKQGDFIWYELLTEDAAKAADFYADVVGWTSAPAGVGPSSYRIFGIGDGHVGGMMDLPAEAKAGGARPGWLGYVAVDDVDAAAAKIVASGGKQHMPPTTLEGVGRIAMLADPQGAMFYIMRGASEGTSTAFAQSLPGHCHWNELNTSDQAAAFEFYGAQFGWKKGDSMNMGPMGEYQFLDHGGQTIGAFAPCQDPQRPAWLYYFGVENIDECVRRINDGGGSIMFGPSEVPGGMFIIIASDPQGAVFGLVGKRQ